MMQIQSEFKSNTRPTGDIQFADWGAWETWPWLWDLSHKWLQTCLQTFPHACCAARDGRFFLSIHEKSGWSSRSQPNLAAPSPSALPSAELSAACLEVNSFMIPLSVLPISKWLILPLWQLLAWAVARPPPSPLFFFLPSTGGSGRRSPGR